MTAIVIRDADLARDKSALTRFLMGSNQFESQWEADRRLDTAFPEEYLSQLVERAKSKQGRLFVAEEAGAVVGWAACHLDEHDTFVKREERSFGYVSEMYVEEARRGRHIGRALLKACEDHFRALGLKSVLISALSPNARALNAYRAAGYRDYAVNLRKIL
jgi:ribosomal protein S18 acetylase RimI-like enzyme